MKRTGRYFSLEMKKAFLTLPRLFAHLALFGLAAAALGALLAERLYGREPFYAAAVAIVSEEEDGYTSALLNYADRIESASAFFHFMETDRAEAYGLLAAGKVTAVIEIPENTVEGILTGNNIPIRVTFGETDSLSDALLAELTKAGASILGSAQAGVYAVSDLNRAYELNLDPVRTFAQLNRANLQYALMRQALFTQVTTSAAGTVSPAVYYAACAALLLLLALGSALHVLFSHESPAFLAVLSHQRISVLSQTSVKLCVLFLTNCFFLPLILFAGKLLLKDTGSLTAAALLQTLPLALFLSAYELFFYYWCPRPAEGLLWLCAVSAVLLFLSGCLLPSAFLPEPLVRAASLTAFPSARKAAEGLFTGASSRNALGALCLHAFICFVLDLAACAKKRRCFS